MICGTAAARIVERTPIIKAHARFMSIVAKIWLTSKYLTVDFESSDQYNVKSKENKSGRTYYYVPKLPYRERNTFDDKRAYQQYTSERLKLKECKDK